MEAVPHGTSRATVTRLPEGVAETDRLAVEEPLEIRVDGTAVAVTMRTPGHDEELALGFCLTEGLQPGAAHPSADLAANVVEVDAPGADLAKVQRSFYTSSSCGVCGKGALEAVAVDAARVDSELAVAFDVVASLPRRLRSAQPAFDLTGGLHATGLFTAEQMVATLPLRDTLTPATRLGSWPAWIIDALAVCVVLAGAAGAHRVRRADRIETAV